MAELFTALTAFPTVVYTVTLGFVVLYWLLVIFGAVDLDGGGHDGALDALAAKGEASASALDALAAKGEASASALDAVGLDADASSILQGGGDAPEPVGLDDAAAAGAFSLRRAPVTVTASFIALFGFILSHLVMRYLGPLGHAAMPEALFGTLVLIGSGLGALPLASLATRPLEGLFRTNEGRKRIELVGGLCEIRSGRADVDFGQAVLFEGGAEFVIDVRLPSAGGSPAPLKRGDKALIIDYDDEKQAYVVEPYGAELDSDFEAGAERRTRSL